jgi:hypothetical protein
MKLDAAPFGRQRSLAPVLDAILNGCEVKPTNQDAGLASRATRSLLTSDLYVISHSTPEWTADAHPELVRAGVAR